MKSLTGGLIFRHSSCSERAPTGGANRAGEDLEHQPACGCTTSREPRLPESSLRKKSGESEIGPNRWSTRIFSPNLLAAVRRSLPPRLPRHALCGAVAGRNRRSVDAGLHAKAVDKDIEQPHDAPLPAGLVMQVAHADQGPQKIFRADVGTYLAGGDGAVQQGTDRFRQAIERKGSEFRGALHRKRQRGRHALLRRDELDIGSQPAPQRVNRVGLTLQLLRQLAELLHLAPIDRLKKASRVGKWRY